MKHKFAKYIYKPLLISAIIFVLISILFVSLIVPKRTIPILMYHAISEVDQKDDPIDIPVMVFKKQMQYLADHNYQVISLRELGTLMRLGKKVSNNAVVLTFDDGDKNFYTQAYPILKKHGFSASIFLVNNWIERTPGNLNWDDIKKLKADDSIDIGAHTLSHRLLPLLSPDEAKKEIRHSKLILEDKLQIPILSFAYPVGALNREVKMMVEEAGYEQAVGTNYQRGQFKDHDVFILKRVVMKKFSKNPLLFRLIVSGYYVPVKELFQKVFNIKTPRKLYLNAQTPAH